MLKKLRMNEIRRIQMIRSVASLQGKDLSIL